MNDNDGYYNYIKKNDGQTFGKKTFKKNVLQKNVDDQKYLSFSNIFYDKCNLLKKEQESLGPYYWVSDSINESPNPCFVEQSPFMHHPFQSIPAKLVNVESDLRNQTRILSQCPDKHFDPTKSKNCIDCKKCDQGLPCNCSHCKKFKKLLRCKTDFLQTKYSRVEKPCNVFTSMSINRFTPLCHDPQNLNTIQSNNYIGTNTRLEIRNAFHEVEEHEKP